jgi:hypothetical protein
MESPLLQQFFCISFALYLCFSFLSGFLCIYCFCFMLIPAFIFLHTLVFHKSFLSLLIVMLRFFLQFI